MIAAEARTINKLTNQEEKNPTEICIPSEITSQAKTTYASTRIKRIIASRALKNFTVLCIFLTFLSLYHHFVPFRIRMGQPF